MNALGGKETLRFDGSVKVPHSKRQDTYATVDSQKSDALFFLPSLPYSILMQGLFDPLVFFAAVGAYPHLSSNDDGSKCVTLTFIRTATYQGHKQAQAVAKKFERLLILQLNVPEGTKPRSVQQLVGSGRIKVDNGRYVFVK